MKVIDQNAVLLDTSNMTPYQVIERVGRTCYKSEDRITEDSATKFVANLYKSGHHAMLEFGWIYLKANDIDFIEDFEHLKTQYIHSEEWYISGSLRAFYDFFEDVILPDGQHVEYSFRQLLSQLSRKFPEVFEDQFKRSGFKSDIDPYRGPKFFDDTFFEFLTREDLIDILEKRPESLSKLLPHTVMFTTDRGVTHELVRHRPCSFAMESTRYCNYSKEKFGGELTFIKPCFDESDNTGSALARDLLWKLSVETAEHRYLKLIEYGATPEQARDVLPTTLKADIWMCATEDEWQHIMDLRYHEKTGKAHPKMKELMGIAYPQLNKASEGRIR